MQHDFKTSLEKPQLTVPETYKYGLSGVNVFFGYPSLKLIIE
jgi:hypothetical protein